MTDAEAIRLLLEFRKSVEAVTKKQDALLAELLSIKMLLLTILNGGVDVGAGRTAEELCEQIQLLMNQKMVQISPGFQEDAQRAGKALATFMKELEHTSPYS